MENLAPDLEPSADSGNHPTAQPQLELVPHPAQVEARESLSENFNSELEAWARHALAANGFGDY